MIVFKIRYCKVISKYIYLDIIKSKYTYLDMTLQYIILNTIITNFHLYQDFLFYMFL